MDVLRRTDYEIRPVPMDVGRSLVVAALYTLAYLAGRRYLRVQDAASGTGG